uniref:Uncharacterized protein n=1 Tax=Paramormyrops kingsleyae TaxID=1676925 RepID=A0A3B3SR98_9TELE
TFRPRPPIMCHTHNTSWPPIGLILSLHSSVFHIIPATPTPLAGFASLSDSHNFTPPFHLSLVPPCLPAVAPPFRVLFLSTVRTRASCRQGAPGRGVPGGAWHRGSLLEHSQTGPAPHGNCVAWCLCGFSLVFMCTGL